MHFAFLLDMEVPYGQVMLSILLNHGLMPGIVIEEASPNAEHHRNLFLGRLGKVKLAPSIAAQVQKHGLKYARVNNLCGAECEGLVRQETADILALGGTRRFIKSNIYSIPRWGTLCSHPGLLPLVRGAASPAWSILYDLQVGCSCFIVDQGLDTGPVIKSKIVPVYFGDTYSDVVQRNITYCGELMAEVLHMFQEKEGPIHGEPQDLSIGKTYKTMPQNLVGKVVNKLAGGTYKWLQARPA
jgi:methionyl-tRNA formyltransferase